MLSFKIIMQKTMRAMLINTPPHTTTPKSRSNILQEGKILRN